MSGLDHAVRNQQAAITTMAANAMIIPIPGEPSVDCRDQIASIPSTEANQPPASRGKARSIR